MSDDDALRLAVARSRATAGLPVDPSSLADDAQLAAAVRLAVALGAPLAPVLDVAGAVAADRARLAAEVRRASAEARSVAIGLVVGPPVVGLLAAGLVADDPLAALATPVGRTVVLVAVVLWAAGAAVVRRLVSSAARPVAAGDDVYVLTATAVRAGMSLPAALRASGRALAGDPDQPTRSVGRPAHLAGRVRPADPAALAWWLDLGGDGRAPPGWEPVAGHLAAVFATGAPIAPVLDELAAVRRRAAHADALERAGRLGARLSLPTALLLLPAGLLLAAGPLVLAGLDALR